ncbi:hypothetical protein D9V34_06565 [Mycetocola lacteus]|uniref:Lipoprotein n=1 Tax=Mycetocola lacteus TaxID=76637 RepID=A0A3L7AR88_9MICO|nr:hypothetical protein [Mycetocola lacteus]RLP82907.1 hypothetical protein D9V34_06565 [Mycetocola lacteus]
MTRIPARILALAGAALALSITVTGCAGFDEMVTRTKAASFQDRDALIKSGITADWVPADAHRIRGARSLDNADMSVLISSKTKLDPRKCPRKQRQSTPSFVLAGAPNAYAAKEVYACGEWSVIPTRNGWFGWTPNHPQESGKKDGPRLGHHPVLRTE